MTTLYPRLSEPDARVLLTQMRHEDVDTLRDRSGTGHPARYFAPTGGIPAAPDHLQQLAAAVRACAQDHGYPTAPVTRSDARRAIAFDRQLTRVIFERTDMSPAEASAPETWTFMAVRLMPDVVKWRWQHAANDERWFGGTLVRHTFARLWWQAYALSVETETGRDYHLLDALSESDLNQIFERRSIGGCAPLARALAAELVETDVHPAQIAHRDLVRDVTKRIRRLIPFTSFVAVDDLQLRARMRESIDASITALTQVG